MERLKQLHPNIYRLTLNLANNPLKDVHSYIIKGNDSSLLIDTGFNNAETKLEILTALDQLEIELKTLQVFITHIHADHAGLAGYFFSQGCEVFASLEDAELMIDLAKKNYHASMRSHITLLDLDRYHIQDTILPYSLFSFEEDMRFTILKEGDSLIVGDYQLTVIDLSGHSPGMIGLYEMHQEFFFTADHILDQISPNIAYWGNDFPALNIFLKNLEKIIPFKVKKIFPSHRNSMSDHPRRALELIDHHHERLKEVLKVCKEHQKIYPRISASHVASLIKWNFRAPSWDDFPDPQKYFATHEAMAHLEYLYHEQKLHKEIIENIAYYSIP